MNISGFYLQGICLQVNEPQYSGVKGLKGTTPTAAVKAMANSASIRYMLMAKSKIKSHVPWIIKKNSAAAIAGSHWQR